MAGLTVPDGACDAHVHVFDPRFAACAPVIAGADVRAYRQVQARLGTSRTVVVQPRAYGTDHRVTLDAIAQLGTARARGIAVLRPDVSERELQRLHEGGIRGVRFTLHTPQHAPLDFGLVEPVAQRIRPLGWHLQLHWTAQQIVSHEALLRRLPVPLVIDHLARVPLPQGARHPAFAIVRELALQGRAWVKLSAPYLCSPAGVDAQEVHALARAWVACAPDRLVWGSDWPHATEQPHPPDAVHLLGLLAEWAASPDLRRRILVDNPAALYGFASC